MNLYAIKAIYKFELARTWRTLMQSIASPVISTSLYFIVFGSAIGPHMNEITLEDTRDALKLNRYVIEVPERIRVRALRAVERMIAIG